MDKEIIGKRIRRERERLALTRDEFAEQIQISPQFLAEIENGKKGMSAETLWKICEKVTVSADYMLLGRQSVDAVKTPTEEILHKIPPKYIEMVEEILQSFLRAVETAEEKKNI